MDKAELVSLLAEGLSLEAIGQRYGRHGSTVGYWVKKHRLKAVNQDKCAPRGGISREALADLTGRGFSMNAMARELGVSPSTVRHWMGRYGLRSTAYVRSGNSSAEKPRSMVRVCLKHGRTTFVRAGKAGSYRCKRCRSERVADRRRKVKAILVAEAGGRCRLCGYDRHPAALHFHHVDPSTKSFALSRQGVTRGIRQSREEAQKCVLLCSNCHAEVEAGLISATLEPVGHGGHLPIPAV